jgi:uncharacterized membrane protein YeaQ/YmgE (transglycosylase-associated protein family)
LSPALLEPLSPGPNNPTGFVVTMAPGVTGTFVVARFRQFIGWYRPDQGACLIGASVGASIILFIWNRLVVYRIIQDPAFDQRRLR